MANIEVQSEKLTQSKIAPPKKAVAKSFFDPSNSLPNLLLRAREGVMRQFKSHLKTYELTEQQWRVLRAVTQADEIEATELAQAAFLLAPSLSRILRDLDERGLLLRRLATEDLRRTIVSVSPKGRALMDAATPGAEAILTSISHQYGQKKLETLLSLLRELDASMLEMGSMNRPGNRGG